MKVLAKTVGVFGVTVCFVAVCMNQAKAQTSTVHIGDTPIALPTPEGYYRIDGKHERVDSILRTSVGKNSRPLAWYGSEIALAETLSGKMSPDRGANFQALTTTLGEKVNITEEQFIRVKKNVKNSNAFVEGLDKTDMERAGSDAMSILTRKTAQMKVGEMISLGVFDETPESISYSFVMKIASVSPDGKTKISSVFIGAHSSVLIHNRLILLSCGTVFHNGAEIESLRNKLKQWKDATVLLNK